MLKKIKDRIWAMLSNRELVLYLLFGVLTTLVDFTVSFVLYKTPINLHVSNTLAWITAVLFAYITNRIWVFESPRHGAVPILLELIAFVGGRVATLLLQEGVFAIFCDWLEMNAYVIKVVAAVLVVVGNYVISKLLIFRRGRQAGE